ncbi:MAG: hypothetical protein Q9220_007663 [cf. Caloplaca sp. 1 TL-2023]
MTSKPVTYVWKCVRPALESKARQLMAAAYESAMKTDPNSSVILIRHDIHATTWNSKQQRHVQDNPHITISTKDAQKQLEKKHETTHGYTKTWKDYTIVDVKPSYHVKSDNTLDRNKKEIWPAGLPSEIVMHGDSTKTDEQV